MRTLILLLALASGACRDCGEAHAPPAPESKTMNISRSPSGDRHPGEIVHDDKVNNRSWTKRAGEVPQTIAWARSGEKWIPVVRIEITGTADRREIIKFGPDGIFLETTISGPMTK